MEVISNGVKTFRQPESQNAATTMLYMSLILGTLFIGISVLASHFGIQPKPDETVVSQIARLTFGTGALYYAVQLGTMLLLALAANSAFAAFPQLASILARDGYMPRQMATFGDRLVFSNGILILGIIACLLLIIFRGDPHALIPLYAVGVFCGFTLSQYGMVKHHQRLQEPGWKRHAAVNAMGAVATGIVLIVVVVSKFAIGAWVPVVLIPLIVLLLRSIKKHYDRVGSALAVTKDFRPRRHTHTVVVLVGSIHRATLAALAYAKSLAPDRLVALTVSADEEQSARIQGQWDEFGIDVPLRILSSPYRELTGPVTAYLDELDAEHENDIITVILPEFVLTRWWEQLLHNQSALLLKARLLFRRNTVVVSVPYHIDGGTADVPGTVEVVGED